MTHALWLRGDLRLSDHAGFVAMASTNEPFAVFFNLDPMLDRHLTPHKRAYLMAALRDLDTQLDGQLSLLACNPTQELPALLADRGITSVITHGSVGPSIRRRLNTAAVAMHARGITLGALDTPYAVAPGTLSTKDATPTSEQQGYRVYTPFYKAWRPRALRATPYPHPEISNLITIDRVFEPEGNSISGGERAARLDMDRFLSQRRFHYASQRDYPDQAVTSGLSTHLHFGTIHPRTIIASLGPDDAKFLAELAWREFYADVLFRNPDAVNQELDVRFQQMKWRQAVEAPTLLDAWKQGRTGYPLVDAGMRELLATHLMHNRVRMVVASFLIKDLHFDWRIGAQYFEQQLLDGDLASNRLNWQWVAGTGTDAAPYFRIFNPILQSKKFDPDGSYIKRWVPELAHLSGNAIHEPSTYLDPTTIGYVAPIVDHNIERQETLARYESAKASTS
jgi:deoxyribodipyrimidine photo-lyase